MASNWQSEIMAAIELAAMDAGKRLVLPTPADVNDTPSQGTAYIADGFRTLLSFHFDFGREDFQIRFFPPGQSPHSPIGFVHAEAVREFAVAYHGDGSAIGEMLAFIKEYVSAQPASAQGAQ